MVTALITPFRELMSYQSFAELDVTTLLTGDVPREAINDFRIHSHFQNSFSYVFTSEPSLATARQHGSVETRALFALSVAAAAAPVLPVKISEIPRLKLKLPKIESQVPRLF